MTDDENETARLIETLRPLAMSLVLHFRRRLPESVLTEDLEAAAMAGVWDAVRLHPEAGDGLRRYAFVRIRGAIMDGLRSQDWLPRKHRARAKDQEAPRQVSFENLRTELRSGADVEAEVAERQVRDRLLPYLRFLPARERHIVVSHYFLEKTFMVIGTEIGVSEPRVSQLHSMAMERLRAVVPRDLLGGR